MWQLAPIKMCHVTITTAREKHLSIRTYWVIEIQPFWQLPQPSYIFKPRLRQFRICYPHHTRRPPRLLFSTADTDWCNGIMLLAGITRTAVEGQRGHWCHRLEPNERQWAAFCDVLKISAAGGLWMYLGLSATATGLEQMRFRRTALILNSLIPDQRSKACLCLMIRLCWKFALKSITL